SLENRNEVPHKPPGPKNGIWSLKYIDKVKAARLVLSRRRRQLYRDFPSILTPGEEFPAIELETTSGERINTGDLRGQKHFVLMSGAIT
ncbi:MAG: hypothetical protein V3V06_05235, partial [Dehalococcoidia bacterium]